MIIDIDPVELTADERYALPAEYHQPTFDGLSRPHSWICAVCWDDGLTSAWPCDALAATGRDGNVVLARELNLHYCT